MVSNSPRFPLSCAEFHRRVLVKMVDWVRGYGWCASLLGLATLSASVSPQRHYLPPLDPAASVTPLCAVSTSVITRYVTTVETQWVTTTLSPSMESSHFLGNLPPAPAAQVCRTTVTIPIFTTHLPANRTAGAPCLCTPCSYAVREDPCECVEIFGCDREPL